MTAAPPLITVSELEAAINMVCDSEDEGSVAAWSAAVTEATEIVRNTCGGRPLTEVVDDTETFRFGAAAILGRSPVTEISLVTVDDAECDFEVVRTPGGLRVIPDIDGDTIVVTYTHGWDVNDPHLAAAKRVAKRVASRLIQNPNGVSSYNNPGGNATFGPDVSGRLLTSDEEKALAVYNPPSVGTVTVT